MLVEDGRSREPAALDSNRIIRLDLDRMLAALVSLGGSRGAKAGASSQQVMLVSENKSAALLFRFFSPFPELDGPIPGGTGETPAE